MIKRRKIVVVDGSNLATEGRTVPSLHQLDESVRAYMAEAPDAEMIVVVDATFEHRIDASERARFKEAEADGEIVVPPAGAVGRGDAFILRIAARADAVVLSNDSFQEFHAEHPWLFDEGRLVGGKPVPGVGWIFTPRNPVRGPKSRAVRSKAKAAAVVDAAAPSGATKPSRAAAARDADGAPAARAPRARRATKAQPVAAPQPRAALAAKPSTRGARAAASRAAKATSSPTKAPAKPAPEPRRTSRATPTEATAKAQPARVRTEPVNTTRSYQRLVADHPVGASVTGEIVQFTSHGAMVAVPVGRTMKVVCYAPLAGLGTPAPTRARDVLKKGEVRQFTVVALDPTRRRAELSLG